MSAEILSPSTRHQFRNADQIVADQIEQQVSADPSKSATLGLRIVPCRLPQPKMHSIMARRVCDMRSPDAASCARRWRCAVARRSGHLIVARDVRRHLHVAQRRHASGRVVGGLRPWRRAARRFPSGLQHRFRGPAFGHAIASSLGGDAACRLSMMACPYRRVSPCHRRLR